LMKTVIRFLIFMLHDHVSCNKQTNLWQPQRQYIYYRKYCLNTQTTD
jgi:hypothetical protein